MQRKSLTYCQSTVQSISALRVNLKKQFYRYQCLHAEFWRHKESCSFYKRRGMYPETDQLYQLDLRVTSSGRRRQNSVFETSCFEQKAGRWIMSRVVTVTVQIRYLTKYVYLATCILNEPTHSSYIAILKGPPLWSCGQEFLAAITEVPGSIPGDTRCFWVAVGLERGLLSSCEDKWGATWKKSSGSGLEYWDQRP
jgi:hypothetical protein